MGTSATNNYLAASSGQFVALTFLLRTHRVDALSAGSLAHTLEN